jgi:hypothetical protein
MPRIIRLLFIFIFTTLLATRVFSVTAQSQEKIYSVYILNFVKGIQWPEATPKKFTIGILSYPPLATELTQTFSSSKIKNHSIEIREYASVEEMDECQIIFIPSFKARAIDRLLSKVGTKPILIVSNKMDMAKKGAGANFVLVEGKPKYEINCKAIEKRGLKISTTVKGGGILVE